MLGQSLINISSGARTRPSGVITALMLLVFIKFVAGLIEMLPMAALTGLIIMVAIVRFEWASISTINGVPRSDIFLMFLISIATVVLHSLALAVIVGLIIAVLVFGWDNAKRI